MQTLSFIVGVVGNVTSLLIFASPIPTFFRIVKSGSTEDFEGLPYVCTFLSSSLWTYYGMAKPGGYLIATVNSVGVVLEFIYVTLFLIYAPPLTRVKTGICVAILDVGFLGAAILVTRLVIHGTLQVTVIGLLCVGLTTVMYASPLAAMKTVITMRSVEYMPFFLSFSLFINGGIWTFYSVLERDIFVGVPNGTGFVFGVVQLILYATYRNAKRAGSRIEELEEARQRLFQSRAVNEVDDGKITAA
ncbi:bidirectional sugar transporter SWEET16-like [Aristolochia californica]|uniref:bidirectional sugar transporter SWEET16-like n=1 Tax=Aristolochia californica TaxID=171875 RepID=UPI0035E148D5